MIERVTSDQGLAQERGREVMLVNFSRPSLGQTGSGHFSPIAAWHPASDMALVLDTARFKYPAFWAPVNKVGGRERRGREGESVRERTLEREVLLTIKKCLKVGKHNALSGNTGRERVQGRVGWC